MAGNLWGEHDNIRTLSILPGVFATHTIFEAIFVFHLMLIQIQVRHFHIPSVHGLSRVVHLLS